MKKQRSFFKGAFWWVIVFLVVLSLGSHSQQVPVVEAKDDLAALESRNCTTQRLTTTYANETMPVPDPCLDGLCKLVLYANSYMGAFGDGYSWEVYYYQWSSVGAWVGGPNMAMGGVELSDGDGQNGDGLYEPVFGGGTSGNGYIRILDDGPNEDDPNLWSIDARGDAALTSATLTACSVPGVISTDLITSSQAIDVPEFCIDSLCMILRWSFDSFGDSGSGFSNPVYYFQNSVSDSWIGGPNITMGAIDYSHGVGDNGDGVSLPIFGGGETELGGVAELLDDEELVEESTTQWFVNYEETDDLTGVYYWFAPMSCIRQDATIYYTNFTTPSFCIDELCTIVRYADDAIEAWGNGLSWPVNYKQDSNDNSWIGGPNLILGGSPFSEGYGMNGDTNSDYIFNSGLSGGGDFVRLRDDSSIAGETIPDQWNIIFSHDWDLNEASFFICSNTCEETILMINKEFLPVIQH